MRNINILPNVSAYGYHYQYDGIGNRTQATEGEAQPLAYHANLLNQYTNLGSSFIPLTGSASADATVTVKATVGETSTYYTPDRQGEAFAVDIPIPPGAGEVTTDLEINAVRFDSEQDLDLVKTVTGSYTASSQPMTYDADGNLLTWDGWLFTWNGENRLIRAEKGLLKIEANYDYMGRRFEKKVFQGETLTKHQRFIYDGYKLIEIRDALNENVLETAYFWQPQALDVPIAMKQGTTLGFYQYDGNKNITGIKAQDGTTLAEYTYGPFGQTLSATGDWSAQNPFRFSSEYHDDETDLIYYNYRHYSPELGRWLSRDPIEENGGVNLYAALSNALVESWDYLGLQGGVADCMGLAGGAAQRMYEEAGDRVSANKMPPFNFLKTIRSLLKSVNVAGYQHRQIIALLPFGITVETEITLAGELAQCCQCDGEIGIMFQGHLGIQIDGGVGTIIGGQTDVKRKQYKSGQRQGQDYFRDSKGRFAKRPSTSGSTAGELTSGPLPPCENNYDLYIAVGAYVEAQLFLVTVQGNVEFGRCSIQKGCEWTWAATANANKGGGAGIRVAVYGEAAAEVQIVL